MSKDSPEKMEAMRSWLAAVAEELNIAPEVMAEAEAPLLQLIGKIAYGPRGRVRRSLRSSSVSRSAGATANRPPSSPQSNPLSTST
nr:molybdopterin-guanine dinucleotide biosynthesis protein [Flaviflexus salsibiostraticola]